MWKRLGVSTKTFSHKLWQKAFVFAMVCLSYVFFRADSVYDALNYLKGMAGAFNPWVLTDGSLFQMGLDAPAFFVLFCALLVLLTVDFLHENGVHLRAGLAKQSLVFRWTVYYAAVFAVILFGVWGPSYQASAFIYFQF